MIIMSAPDWGSCHLVYDEVNHSAFLTSRVGVLFEYPVANVFNNARFMWPVTSICVNCGYSGEDGTAVEGGW